MIIRRAAIRSALLLLGLGACSTQPANLDGAYLGLEPMPGFADPAYPNRQWFRENRLIIRDGGIRLETFPITIDPGSREISYQASEGGVFSFKGRIVRSNNDLKAMLSLSDSPLANLVVGPDGTPPEPREKSVTGMLSPDGAILLDGVAYRRIRGAKSDERTLVLEAFNRLEKEQRRE